MKIFNEKANQASYPFSLPELPFDKNAFKEVLSAETFDYHHGKHHNAYVQNANKLLADHNLNSKNLEEVILASSNDSTLKGIFNNAAQIWNHSFYWHSLTPNGGGEPQTELMEQINQDFGSFEKFKEEFKTAGATQFGSGWAWLVYKDGKLKITKTANAELPITEGETPLLTCDVWEHAYYIDYRNQRPAYLDVFLDKLVNWSFAEENFKNAKQS